MAGSKFRTNGLTEAEYQVYLDFESKGYEVLHSGWPDFLVVTGYRQVRFVEVKRGDDRINTRQQRMIEVLRAHLGIEVEVIRLYESRYVHCDRCGCTHGPKLFCERTSYGGHSGQTGA